MGEESIVRGQQIITSIHSSEVITKFTWRSVFRMSTQQLEIDKIIRPIWQEIWHKWQVVWWLMDNSQPLCIRLLLLSAYRWKLISRARNSYILNIHKLGICLHFLKKELHLICAFRVFLRKHRCTYIYGVISAVSCRTLYCGKITLASTG